MNIMKTHKRISEDKETNVLSQVIFRYVPYWPLFAVLCVVAFAGSWLYLRYVTPLYESTARVLIKDERKGAEDTKAVEELNLLSTKKIIENEMEVIQSRTLIHEVVKNLHLYAPVYEEGKIRAAVAYNSSPVVIQVPDAEKIKEVKKVPFRYEGVS